VVAASEPGVRLTYPRVRLLDPHTVNQIAAGEVVERPASVVKELVENALDAGATRVLIDIEEAGRRRIRVEDDGRGMSPEDAESCLQRHATSKIGRVEDLDSVRTLGFRGEAIPSIASVSRMELTTGENDGGRTRILVVGGTVEEIGPVPGPRGTTVVVDDLFFNTPARLKFLKRDATEMGAITELIGKYAIAYPAVYFRLRHHDHGLIESPGDGDELSAMAAVWGRDTVRALAGLDCYREGIRARGYISGPSFTRPTRSQQWIFVNGRPVKNRALLSAIDAAFRQLTPDRRYPVAMLSIHVDPARVDMNVSPTKSECRFQHEGAVFDAVRAGIKDALLANGMVPSAASIARANDAVSGGSGGGYVPYGGGFGGGGLAGGYGGSQGAVPGGPIPGNAGRGDTLGFNPVGGAMFDTQGAGGPVAHGGPATQGDPQAWIEALKRLYSPLPTPGTGPHSTGEISGAISPGTPGVEFDPFAETASDLGDHGAADAALAEISRAAAHLQANPFAARFLDGLRILGQTSDAFFIVAENHDGLMIIDQHVAHERILFERLRDVRGLAPIERQPLLTPIPLELDRRLAGEATEHMEALASAGFELEAFGPSSFLIRGVPAALKRADPAMVLRDLLEDLVDGTRGSGLSIRENVWVMCACKLSIKAGERLGMPEMEKLLFDLALTENPYLCPHGRPITIMLSRLELLKKFKRA